MLTTDRSTSTSRSTVTRPEESSMGTAAKQTSVKEQLMLKKQVPSFLPCHVPLLKTIENINKSVISLVTCNLCYL